MSNILPEAVSGGGALWMQIIILVTLVIKILSDKWDKKEDRQFWEKQEAARVKEAERLRQIELEDREYHLRQLGNKIDENTKISENAFLEANELNKKILAIGELRTRGSEENRKS